LTDLEEIDGVRVVIEPHSKASSAPAYSAACSLG